MNVVFFSAVLSALGNLLSQALESKKKLKEGQSRKEVDVYGPVRFAVYGYDDHATTCSFLFFFRLSPNLLGANKCISI